jgi:anti-sigma B factor antagonist
VKIREEKVNDAAVCFLEGEVNINNTPELRKAFDGLISKGEKKVIVDFSAVTYIDSSGLATLIEMFQRLKKINGRLRFCNMEQKIKNVFEITKLHKLFDIADSRENALKDF